MQAFLDNTMSEFQKLRKQAESALSQVSDDEFFRTLDAESNNLAVLCQHLGGNMMSRWSGFLTEDGEKPDRRRDAEFEVASSATRAQIMERWQAGWQCLFDNLGALTPEDLGRTIRIRSQPLSVLEAIHRQLTHAAGHVGQIVFLARHWKGGEWETLSVPRGRSEEFHAAMREKYGSS